MKAGRRKLSRKKSGKAPPAWAEGPVHILGSDKIGPVCSGMSLKTRWISIADLAPQRLAEI